MLLIKDVLLYSLITFSFIQCKSIKSLRSSDDYDEQSVYSDYFDTTEKTNIEIEATTSLQLESNTSKSVEQNEDDTDDGVTCSATNVTEILSEFDVENFVLVLFRLNVTTNERELIHYLNLAKRFSEGSSLFIGHRFIVVTMDRSSDIVKDFIERENFPSDIVVLDEDEYPDLGFVIDFDELHVHVVDPCGKLSYIIVPPWSSAQHPYVKAAILSTILDLPCDCHYDSAQSKLDAILERLSMQIDETTTEYYSTSTSEIEEITTSTTNDEDDDIDEDVENIENLLDNPNSINDTFNNDENITLALRIIIPSVHVHFDNHSQNYYKYDEIILKTDDENSHQHYDSGDVLLDITDERMQNFTDNIFVGNNSFADIKERTPNKILVNRLGYAYEILKKQMNENFQELIPLDFDVVQEKPSIQIFGVVSHYKQLNKWLFYKV